MLSVVEEGRRVAPQSKRVRSGGWGLILETFFCNLFFIFVCLNILIGAFLHFNRFSEVVSLLVKITLRGSSGSQGRGRGVWGAGKRESEKGKWLTAPNHF